MYNHKMRSSVQTNVVIPPLLLCPSLFPHPRGNASHLSDSRAPSGGDAGAVLCCCVTASWVSGIADVGCCKWIGRRVTAVRGSFEAWGLCGGLCAAGDALGMMVRQCKCLEMACGGRGS